MSVPNSTSRVSYTLTSTTQTLSVPFYFLATTDLQVIKQGTTPVTLAMTTNYTVTGAGVEAGGSITLTGVGVSVSDVITIKRNMSLTQPIDLVLNDRFPSPTVERMSDRSTMQIQQVSEIASRSLRFEDGETTDGTLVKTARSSKVLSFDENGDISFITPEGVLYTPGDSLAADSIASLKAISVSGLTNNQAVSVLGYYAAGDGGGGTFYYDSASATADNGGTVIQPTTGTGRWKRIIGNSVDFKFFGAKGDGTTDDTTYIQSALNSGINVTSINGVYKTTSGLTHTSGTLLRMGTNSFIRPYGTGYTALTISSSVGFQSGWIINIDGVDRPTINGLRWDNPAGQVVESIRVNGLNGFGVKLEKCWDCFFSSVSVEKSGNSSDYAFQLLDPSGADTSNETHFARLQVEEPYEKAIYISPNSLNCTFSNIHSERCVSSSIDLVNQTWSIGGNRCTYESVRLSSSTPANANIRVSMAQGSIELLSEGSVSVVADGFNGNNLVFIRSEIAGDVQLLNNQTGLVTFIGCKLNTVSGFQLGARYENCKITTFSPSTTGTLPAVLRGCTITNFSPQAAAAFCHVVNCTVTNGTPLANSRFVADKSIFTSLTLTAQSNVTTDIIFNNCDLVAVTNTAGDSAATFNNCQYYGSAFPTSFVCNGTIFNNACSFTDKDAILTNCKFLSNVTCNTVSGIWNGVYIAGTLTRSAGSIGIKFNDCIVVGTVTSYAGPPDGAVGANYVGMKTEALKPAVGSPKAWLCTVAGSPGTWVSTGNL